VIVHTVKTLTMASIFPYQSKRESDDETLELVIQPKPEGRLEQDV